MDLSKFKNTLPYSSELFGVYQPLLGWKSKRIVQRFSAGVKDSDLSIVDALLRKMHPDAAVKVTDFTADEIFFNVERLNPGTLTSINKLTNRTPYKYFITDLIQKRIVEKKLPKGDDSIWEKLVSEDAFAEFLPEVSVLLKSDQRDKKELLQESYITRNIPANQRATFNFNEHRAQVSEILVQHIEMESAMAGTLNQLFKLGKFDILSKIFFQEEKVADVDQMVEMAHFLDPLENFDPRTEIGKVALSPIGLVHLFRQYFFEFDNFLGPPVEHIWLSPGASLELLEVHTRKYIVENTLESFSETIVKSENSTTTQDDISTAIKDENQSNTKFGMSVNAGATVSGGVPNLYSATGHIDTTTSYGMENNQKLAKEAASKNMRQQSDKLSSEIRNNFKTTFKTVSETQDLSSKRYVLQNTTAELVNYELRRKMRQVGVQVQDIGTSLCWQTYVDLPGNNLGLATLVHIAEPPNLSGLPHPQQGAEPQPITKDYTTKLYFKGWNGDNDTVETYTEHGNLDDKGGANADFEGDYIHMNYLDYKVETVPGYDLSQVVYENCLEGKMVDPVFFSLTTDSFSIHLRKVNFDGDSLTLKLKLIYKASADSITAAKKKYDAEMLTYTAEKAKLAKDAYIKEAQSRIKIASNIKPRKFEELREEERTVIYRYLIGDLLNVDVDLSNSKTRHIMAELINSMFDVDKMLYFTAPEWWMPRAHNKSLQNVGKLFTPPTNGIGRVKEEEIFKSSDIVSWGGASENYRPNYFISEDSTPAKLGSSLGWLLQLDGDNIRNAFLNAPWVKTVIPIRPGKELAALNWLMKAEVEGADGIKAQYQEGSQEELDTIIDFLEKYPFDKSDPRKVRYADFGNKINTDPGTFFVTIEDALIYLSLKVKTKHEASNKTVTEEEGGDFNSYLPTEKVFENGFDPLKGGFQAETEKQFEVFNQWIEVLPTDQVVAVEVKYNPKTGRQI